MRVEWIHRRPAGFLFRIKWGGKRRPPMRFALIFGWWRQLVVDDHAETQENNAAGLLAVLPWQGEGELPGIRLIKEWRSE